MAPSPADSSAETKRKMFASKGSSKTPSIEEEQPHTPTPVPTSTPAPTSTSTSTPVPTSTSTPTPTPVPTSTPTPTPAPVSVPSSPRRPVAQSMKFPEKRRVTQRVFSERRRTSILVGQRSLDFMNETRPQQKGPKFVTFIIKLYKKWGYFIVNHDWQAIVICLIISCLAMVKILLTPQLNDITGYSPYKARARAEYTSYQEFFAHDGRGLALYIFVTAKDGGTMLRSDHVKEVIDILDYTVANFTLYIEGTKENKTFNEFCNSFCEINEPVRLFNTILTIQEDIGTDGDPLGGRTALEYPMSSIFGRRFSIQDGFYGIELYNETNPSSTVKDPLGFAKGRVDHEKGPDLTEDLLGPVEDSTDGLNGTDEANSESWKKKGTNIKYLKMIVLQFRAEHELGWNDQDVKKYELEIVKYFENTYKSDNLKIYVLAQSYIEEEMVRAGKSLVPYLSVGFLIMCCCACVSVMVRALYMHQHSLPKVLLAVAACVVPFMSCATALSLMFIFGARFASILCVVPFLVLAIGVDSSYLMIHEWQRVIQHCRTNPDRRNSQIGYRIAEVLSEVGPAILISTLTNILADAVGSFTSSPEITLLCVGNLTSMLIAFIYQMTCYTGLMSLIGRYEIKVERKERSMAEYSLREKKINISKHNQLTRQQSKFHEETKEAISKTMWAYVNFVANKSVAALIIISYFAYLALSVYGITRININLSTQKLFSRDSSLLELDQLRVKYQIPRYTMATVFVNRPGNFSDEERLKKMNQFVRDMEAIGGSWGPLGTKYFIRDFLEFQQTNGEFNEFEEPQVELLTTEPDSNSSASGLVPKEDRLAHLYNDDNLRDFTDYLEFSYWAGFFRLDNDSNLEKFFFTTAYQGDELSIWTERGNLLNKWRNVVDNYSDEFEASVFNEDAIFLDLIENMPSDTWQSVTGALVCMGFVCYIFLNSWFAVTIATTAVLSICTGILGLISWWGIDLDPISMAALIICVGSSCDLPAHTSFHYYLATVRGKDSSPQEKLANCLSTIAFPAIQAAVSMILCVSSLLFVDLYMSSVFVKTMTLCVTLCNIHALVFIPAFLVMWDYIGSGFKTADKVTPESDIESNDKPSTLPKPTGNGKRTPSPNPV